MRSCATLGGTNMHTIAFEDLKKALKDSNQLACPDVGKAICVHTDASERFWASVVTQCDMAELSKPKIQQSQSADWISRIRIFLGPR